MSVQIRKMTKAEFELFYHWSVEQNVKELMEELHLSREEAMKKTTAELAQMLPDGLNTEYNHLLTIVADEECAGFIWTVHEEFEGRKQNFVCDFAIWESKRRKGYGAAALSLVEKHAADAGCQESVLFVSNENDAAIALYQKCGYHLLRPEGYGKYMVKSLS